MGTHPIFESDFDCLTEIGNSLNSTSPSRRPGAKRSSKSTMNRRSSTSTRSVWPRKCQLITSVMNGRAMLSEPLVVSSFFFLRARAATAHAELENASVSPSVDALSTITFHPQLDCRQEGRRRDSRSYRHPDPSPIGTQESIQHPYALLFGQIRPCYPVRCSTHHLQGW